ncbi:2'-5'-oligoadenylate synthase 3-like isoform X1 [Pelodiscus sinensis]|uniref:2'-5'-oligoadenylate synthase 3-like isoform X1 n=1 Tax=Pelodiscus sinensis TaxID=13735 RepID=UPI003F6D712F
MAVDLYQTPARKLDKFIFDNLQPDCTFLRQAGQAIDTICEFLKTNCFVDQPTPRTKVLKIIKGGSLGKGTSLKGTSDADLVVFLSCFKGYDDQERNRAEIIREIQRMLKKCQQQKQFDVIFETSQWSNPRVLSFQLHSKMLNESIDFDVLPAYNALSSSAKPDPQVYEDLIVSYSRGGEFSTCFTELQRDFVVDRYTKVKSLIRLVKHWYKQYVCPHKKYLSKGKEFLPPQYALELLSIYAWERGSKNRGFDMAKGFRTVLELIQQYKQLCVYWTVNYNFADEELAQFLHRQLQKTRLCLGCRMVKGAWNPPPQDSFPANTCCRPGGVDTVPRQHTLPFPHPGISLAFPRACPPHSTPPSPPPAQKSYRISQGLPTAWHTLPPPSKKSHGISQGLHTPPQPVSGQ